MNLRDLEYLVAVADLRHFRKAADKCFVSQPTLSGQLKKLEDFLGVRLVERTKRQVMLTPIGEKVVERARRALAEAEAIVDLARAHLDPMHGTIRVGLIPTLAPYVLPLIAEPIKQSYPGLELVLHEGQTEVLIHRLKNGELEMIILAVPVEGQEKLDEFILFEEPFYLAVHQGHPLASREMISQSDLDGETVLLLEDGHCLRGQALDLCLASGASEAKGFRATSLETLRHMVATGNGITLIPQLALGPLGDSGEGSIRYLPFYPPVPSRSIGMLFRPSSGRRACFEKLAVLIRKIMDRR